MLYIFDMDGTVVRAYMDAPRLPYDVVEILPGRVEKLAALQAQGHRIAIATNQGGVAFGYNTEQQTAAKFALALEKLGLPATTPIAVCFSGERSKIAQYKVGFERRKPSGAMLRELMALYPGEDAIMIGDRPEDKAAASDAGIPFVEAEEFFRVQT